MCAAILFQCACHVSAFSLLPFMSICTTSKKATILVYQLKLLPGANRAAH